MVITIGIDPSLRRTGVCICNDGDYQWWPIPVKDSIRGTKRLHYIKSAIHERTSQYKIDCAAVEGYSYGSPGRLAQLGELGGVVRLYLYERGIDIITLSPTQLKKYITGNGRADKYEMVNQICVDLDLPPDQRLDYTQDDEADAIGLAMIANDYVKNLTPLIRHRLEILQSLRRPTKKKRKPSTRTSKTPKI